MSMSKYCKLYTSVWLLSDYNSAVSTPKARHPGTFENLISSLQSFTQCKPSFWIHLIKNTYSINRLRLRFTYNPLYHSLTKQFNRRQSYLLRLNTILSVITSRILYVSYPVNITHYYFLHPVYLLLISC